jgi:hypothetical protein
MQVARTFTAGFLLAALIVRCGKSDDRCTDWPTNTVFEPQEYLPIHPGSWWTYSAEDGSQVVKAVSADYVRHSFVMGACTTRAAKVPFWDGHPMYGYRYPASERIGEPSVQLVSLVKDEPRGTYWILDHWAGTMSFRRIIARDTTILANGIAYDNVISVAQGTGGSPFPGQSALHEYRHYAKGIGLVRVDRVSLTDTVPALALQSYYIHP